VAVAPVVRSVTDVNATTGRTRRGCSRLGDVGRRLAQNILRVTLKQERTRFKQMT
jgi:molybdenum-dependent DNA-binding transcriptional regulator ModE